MRYKTMVFILSVIVLLGCTESRVFRYKGTVVPGKWIYDLKVPYNVHNSKEETGIQVYFPEGFKPGDNSRVLIALPEYTGNMSDWRVNTAIESYADRYGMVIVSPNTRRTVYETEYFPETELKWDGIPATLWIGDVLIPYLRNTFAIAHDKDKTAICGFAMGARGAFMAAARYPEYFSAIAGLAGYYDKQSLTRGRIFAFVYGKHGDHTQRWKEKDNLINMADSLKEYSIFLAHGGKDNRVPVEQSRLMAIRLKQLDRGSGTIQLHYIEKKYKVHDWAFCRSVLEDMMAFFDRSLEK